MASPIVVSVVTPTLNARTFIADCVESVRTQRCRDGAIEHVVVDGGSTDGTVEYVEAQGVRLLRGRDRGIFDAINRGSRASTGDWIGFLGADDMLLDGALEVIVAAARRTAARWITGGVCYIDGNGQPLGRLQPLPGWIPTAMHACLGWSAIHHVATYLRRDFFLELDGFNIEYTVAADYELFCRASMRERCHRIPRPIAAMRRTGHNFSARHDHIGRSQGLAIRQAYGPRSPSRQRVYRELARAWVNAVNPTWSLRKVFGRPY